MFYQIMKGEILSRIQSYQTIRGKSTSNLHQKDGTVLRQVINPVKMNKYIENNDESIRQVRIDTQGSQNCTYSTNKIGKKKLDPLLSQSKSLKRIFHSGSHFHRPFRNIAKQTIDSLKQTLNYEKGDQNETLDNNRFSKQKKLSFKQTNFKEMYSYRRNDSDVENAPLNQNNIKEDEQKIQNEILRSSKDLGEYRLNSKKDLMKVFNSKGLYTRIPTSHTSHDRQSITFKSQKCIKLEKLSPSRSKLEAVNTIDDQKIGRYDEEETNTKSRRLNKLTKTTAVFLKDKKYVPYFDITAKVRKNQKKNYTTEAKKCQTCKNIVIEKQLNTMPLEEHQNKTTVKISQQNIGNLAKKIRATFAHHTNDGDIQCETINEDIEEVSIELNQSIQKDSNNLDLQQTQQRQQNRQSNMQSFGISRIEEQSMSNESSFLEESQKRLLKCIESMQQSAPKKQKKDKKGKKKHWGQLPTDFMGH